MHIEVRRTHFGSATLGKMYIDGSFYAYTLEDRYRGQLANAGDKVKSETAIPTGSYDVIVDISNRFKKEMPHVLNVRNFEGIRIHGGNTSADTEGCILIGSETDGQGRIWDCAPKVNELILRIKAAGRATLTVENVPVAAAV